MNEADTRANLVEPKLRAAGWTGSQVTREFFYQREGLRPWGGTTFSPDFG